MVLPWKPSLLFMVHQPLLFFSPALPLLSSISFIFTSSAHQKKACSLRETGQQHIPAATKYPQVTKASHHAGSRPPALHEASSTRFQCHPDELQLPDHHHHHTAPIGGGAHASAQHPDCCHFLCCMLSAPAHHLLHLLLPLLHWFNAQRLAHDQEMQP